MIGIGAGVASIFILPYVITGGIAVLIIVVEMNNLRQKDANFIKLTDSVVKDHRDTIVFPRSRERSGNKRKTKHNS